MDVRISLPDISRARRDDRVSRVLRSARSDTGTRRRNDPDVTIIGTTWPDHCVFLGDIVILPWRDEKGDVLLFQESHRLDAPVGQRTPKPLGWSEAVDFSQIGLTMSWKIQITSTIAASPVRLIWPKRPKP